jgi:type I restriction enzyme M protein
MADESKLNKLMATFTRYGHLHGIIPAGVSFLYLDFSSRFPTGNSALRDIAEDFCRQYVSPIPDKKAEDDIKAFVHQLAIQENEFSSIALAFVDECDDDDRFIVSSPYVCKLVCGLLGITATDAVFDMGSGYGTFLGFVGTSSSGVGRLSKPDLLGQEINPRFAAVSKMLLEMCESTYVVDNSDAFMKKPPFTCTKAFVFPPIGARISPRTFPPFSEPGILIGPRTSYEWVFVLRALESLQQNGTMVALLLEGPLFKTQDSKVRQYLLNNHYVEGIISLPANALYGTGVKTNLLILSKRQNQTFKVLDAEQALAGLPIKGLHSDEAVVDVLNAYESSSAVLNQAEINSSDSSFTIPSLLSKRLYDEMPSGVELGKVADVIRGTSMTVAGFGKNLASRETPYRLLTSSSIENGLIDYGSLPCIMDPRRFEDYFAHKGDLIVTVKSTKVKLAVVLDEPDSPLIVTGGMLIVRPKPGVSDATFIKMFLDSSDGRKVLESVQKGAVIRTIYYDDFLRIRIPCPALKIQQSLASDYNKMLLEYKKELDDIRNLERSMETFYDDSKAK